MENNIIITGAAQRLGLHCALSLQQAGYQVIATYRSEKPGLVQLREAGVQNAIAPALLMFNEHDDAQYRQKALQKSLLQVEPGAAELTNTVLYLLHSRYITGKVLALDGGRPLKLP